jgi:three-Cys-motif partner protein
MRWSRQRWPGRFEVIYSPAFIINSDPDSEGELQMSRQQDDFFNELKEWSARKLTIIKKYMDGFVRILGGKGLVYYVDGFAGVGIYKDDSIGSPIQAAEYAKQLFDQGKAYSLSCINVEMNNDSFSNLCQSTAPYSQFVENLPGSFSENLDVILKKVAQQPAIFFLDDFGVSGVGWELVQKLIGRNAATDLWIRFDHSTVRRLDGFFASDASTADKKFSRLPALYGITDRAQLHQQLDGPSSEKRIQNALRLYLRQLAAEFQRQKGKGFAAAYPIRSLTGTRKYHLVFSASHPKAAVLASNIIYGTEEDYQREVAEYKERNTQQLSLFSLDPTPEHIFEDKVKQLQEAIRNHYQGKTIARIDLHTSLLMEWFGKVSGKHLTAALKSLQSNGQLIKVDGPISNDYTKLTFRRSN